jgi:hypothetical protein
MSQSMHDLSAEELQTLATKAIDAKATAYCMLFQSPFVSSCNLVALKRRQRIFYFEPICDLIYKCRLDFV